MTTPTLLEAAIAFAVVRHAGQADKGGQPYVLHVLRVVLAVPPDEACRVAAVLHDVVEDTATSLAELEAIGVGGEVLEAVALLTRDPAAPYLDHVRRLAGHRVARAVKRADLLDNMDLARLGREPGAADLRRVARYRRAMVVLDGAEGR